MSLTFRQNEETYGPARGIHERLAVCQAEVYADDPPLHGPDHPLEQVLARQRQAELDPLAQLTRFEDLVGVVQGLLDLDAIEHPEDLQRWSDRWGYPLHIKPVEAVDVPEGT